MRSREALLSVLLAGVLLLSGAVSRAQVVESVSSASAPEPRTSPRSAAPAASSASAIDAPAVWRAERAVRADPLWGGDEKEKVLRFKKTKDDEDEDEAEKPKPNLWWVDLLDNLSGGLRVALWLLGAGALIWVLLRMRDWLKGHEGGRGLTAAAPTHVGSLDIRPESLPDDIGAAARALWQRGEQRAALSLLYRGALSRLVHGHGVPIRSASTERDCVVLAATRLSPASLDFLKQLVSGWQTVAYARRELPAERFEALCADFDARMAVAAPTGAAA